MGNCKDNFNVMDEIRKLISEMDDRKPEPECCNIPCPPLGCPQGPCPGMCSVQGNPDPCCVSKMPQCPSKCSPHKKQHQKPQELNFVSPCCSPKKYCLPPVPFPPLKKYKPNCRPTTCCPPACPPKCPSYIQICYPPICPPPRQAPCQASCSPSCPPPPCCPPAPQKKLTCCPTPNFMAGQSPSILSLPCPKPKNNNPSDCCQTFIVSIPPR